MYLLGDSTGKICVIVPIIASYHYIHEFNQLLGVRLGVTVGVAVAVVMMAGTIILITSMSVFWKHASYRLLASAISSKSSFSSALLSASGKSSIAPNSVVRPNLGRSSTILQVCHGFDTPA
jgi:hypothetical protein